MGQRGPVPNSPALAKLRGTYRPQRHTARPAPLQVSGAVDAPLALLDDVAKRIWHDTVAAAPWLRTVDEPLLALYCEAIARWRQALVHYTKAQNLPPEACEPKELDSIRLQLRVAARDVRENARALAIPPNVRMRLQAEQSSEAERFGFVLARAA